MRDDGGRDLDADDPLQEERQQHQPRAGRRWRADEEVAAPVRPWLLRDERCVEARKPEARADREDQRADPSERAKLIEPPDEDEERRRHTEVHKVGE